VTIDGFAFYFWGGYTGKERSQFIEQFMKEKGRAPKDDEIPTFDNLAFYKKVTSDFQAQGNANVNIAWEALAYKDGRPKVEVRVAAGDPPDIVVWSMVDSMRFAILGALLDLSEVIEPYRSLYNPAFLRQFQGKYMHLPMKGFIHGWKVNPLLFKAHGVDNLLPTEQTGWMWSHDTFLQACQAVTKGSGSTATYGFAGYGDWNTLYPLTFSFGGRVWSEDGKSFVMADDPKAIQGIQFFVDMVKKYKITPPENMSSAVDDLLEPLYLGARVGIVEIGTYGEQSWFNDQVKLGKVDPTKVQLENIVAPSDVKNNVKPQHYLGADGAAIFKRKETERNDAAIAFLTFMQKPEYAAIYRGTGWPLRKDLETDEDKDPYKVRYIQRMSSFGSEQLTTPWWVAARTFVNPMWDAIVQGTKPILEIVKDTQAKVNAFIKEELKRIGG